MVRTVLIGWAASLFLSGDHCVAADKAKVQDTIKKAQAFIAKQKSLPSGVGSIAALAYVKSGGDRNGPLVQEVLKQSLQKVQDGIYTPTLHHNYEAAVDILLFEALDPKLFRAQIDAAANYIIAQQQPNGAWYYPHRVEPDCGDTSITQYSIMGLWGAARVGFDVPVEVLEKAARWHIKKQNDDGSFSYAPFESRSSAPPPQRDETMTAAGTSSLLIIRRMLFGDVAIDLEAKQAESKPRFGVLERLADDKTVAKNADVGLKPRMIDDSLKKSLRWIIAHLSKKGTAHETFFAYHLYSLERVGALMDVVELGGHDWYKEGADELVTRQQNDGSWNDEATAPATTAMAMMFLTKVTTTVIKPKPKINLMGGGLQAGGRGLPDNLNTVQVKQGTVSSRKLVGSIDNLLIELGQSSDAKVEDIQAAVVESVQLDRSEELIGQVARLRKLAVDTRLEVRRTAMWALGRSGDISASPVLIRGLADPDLSIAREASLALCILSRRPEGCGKAIDPADDSQMGLTEDASDDKRRAVLDEWSAESIRRWTDWYQRIRSYDERDDRTAIKKALK